MQTASPKRALSPERLTQQAISSHIETIDTMLRDYRRDRKRLLVSSSFQTHSIPLLHIISQLTPDTPVAFLETGYHFAETISFRDEVAELLDLDLVIVRGNEQPPSSGLYVTSETSCCAVNKVEPLHELLEDFDIWVSGVRADQTSTRSGFSETMPGPVDTERYHPMLYWTTDNIETYRAMFDLPSHPLDALGYRSIGCAPCTTAPLQSSVSAASATTTIVETDRSGRWSSSSKTECGLHLP